MRSRDDSRHNLVLDAVAINLNMLCIVMKGEIAKNIDSNLIITLHRH